MIGNGWYDPLLQFAAYYNYTVDNTYDVHFKHEWQYDEMYLSMFGRGNCRSSVPKLGDLLLTMGRRRYDKGLYVFFSGSSADSSASPTLQVSLTRSGYETKRSDVCSVRLHLSINAVQNRS